MTPRRDGMTPRGLMILAAVLTIVLAGTSVLFPWWTRTDHVHFQFLTVEWDSVSVKEFRVDGYRQLDTNRTNLGNVETVTDLTVRYSATNEPNKGGLFFLTLLFTLVEIGLGLAVVVSAAAAPRPGRGSGRVLAAVLLLFVALTVPAYFALTLPGAAIADQQAAGEDIVVDSFSGVRSASVSSLLEVTTTWGPSPGWYLSIGAAITALVAAVAAFLLGRSPTNVYSRTPVIHVQGPQPPWAQPPRPPGGQR